MCDGPDSGVFQIGGAGSDELQTSVIFDYETKSSYIICVRSSDGNGGTFDEQFMITITDANDAPTDITLSSSMISESQPVGTIVGTLSATDVDPADTHTFSLVF